MGSAEKQGPLWDQEAGDWVKLQAPLTRPLWEAMIAASEVGQDTRFFDAGCGGGGACILAAEGGADVTGLDASQALINIARERLPRGTFVVGDLEELPFEDQAFEVSFASCSLMLAEDMSEAARELVRVTEPRGRVVAGAWGHPVQCDMRHVFEAIREAVPESLPGAPFALSEEGALEELLESAGVEVSGGEEVSCPFTYPDRKTLWRALRSAGPMQGAIEMVGEAKVQAAVQEAARPFQENGEIRLENTFQYVVAVA